MALRCAGAIACALWLAPMTGCGAWLVRDNGLEPLFVSDCEGFDPAEVGDVVLIDWSGGVSRIYPDWELPGLDFEAFATTDGGTLADDEEAFKEAVRSHVAGLLCDFPVPVSVRTGEGPSEAPYNVVYVAQVASLESATQIAEAEYDRCNEDHDDEAIVYSREIERLGGPFTFDEWVTLFGNVIAHEIGHVLGFGHVEREDTGEGHPLYVELMLDTHTLDEMLSSQRFLSDLSNCPAVEAQQRRIATPAVLTCGER